MRLAAIKSPTSAAMPSVITGRLKLVIIIRQSTEIRQLHTVDVILEALSAAMVRMTAKFALSRPCLFREYLASPSNKESSLSVVAITLALDIALHTPIIAAYIDAISIRSGLNTASPAA